MPRRRLLKKNLFLAWQRCIESDYYLLHRINSERSLQASFWAQLKEEGVLPPSQRMFIEPAIRLNGKVLYPDLIVCNSREIIGVVELKYTPRSFRARVKKDIGTLCTLARHQGEIAVANSRYWGEVKRIKHYCMSRHVVFCWAGVHREPENCVNQRFDERLKYCGGVGEHSILQLHAVTKKGDRPNVFPIPRLGL